MLCARVLWGVVCVVCVYVYEVWCCVCGVVCVCEVCVECLGLCCEVCLFVGWVCAFGLRVCCV